MSKLLGIFNLLENRNFTVDEINVFNYSLTDSSEELQFTKERRVYELKLSFVDYAFTVRRYISGQTVERQYDLNTPLLKEVLDEYVASRFA